MKSTVASYKKAAILSASPERLIMMLYDGAHDAMQRAKAGFKIEDVKLRNEAINNNLIKAQNIFSELQRSLRMDGENQFAEAMFGLYDFYTTKLNEANLNKDEAPVDLVIELFSEIREAWNEMLTKQSAKGETVIPVTGLGLGEGFSLRA